MNKPFKGTYTCAKCNSTLTVTHDRYTRVLSWECPCGNKCHISITPPEEPTCHHPDTPQWMCGICGDPDAMEDDR